MQINDQLTPQSLTTQTAAVFTAAGEKIRQLHRRWSADQGAPVFTVDGQYTSRGWTEWTQGFQFGMPLLQFDATGDEELLELGRRATLQSMAPHLTHLGVHDHGFNNVSTYGNLLRLATEGRFECDAAEREVWRLALQVSGAVQAARWTEACDGLGFIHSFNGPHSLFADTMRSLRSLALGHQLGHVLLGEQDRRISLLQRLLTHAETTARFNVYYGAGRDRYDIRGRVAHESIFNTKDGAYRCPSSQQGYSPFTTWTRGHAWALCGFSELIEWLDTLPEEQFARIQREKSVELQRCLDAARATADFYLEQTPADGVPYWDTGAPGLAQLGDYRSRAADPENPREPVDSSAAAISAQGLLRLGGFLSTTLGDREGTRYTNAGLTVAATLFAPPYLATDTRHEGLLLHSIYHHPNGWDHVPEGRPIASGEACMWGDYHLLELAVILQRQAEQRPAYRFFDVGE